HDSGASWRRGHESGFGVFSIAVSPSDPGSLLAATSPWVMASADGGVTWSVTPHGPSTGYSIAVAFDPANAGVAYASNHYFCQNGPSNPSEPVIDKTTDGG